MLELDIILKLWFLVNSLWFSLTLKIVPIYTVNIIWVVIYMWSSFQEHTQFWQARRTVTELNLERSNLLITAQNIHYTPNLTPPNIL